MPQDHHVVLVPSIDGTAVLVVPPGGSGAVPRLPVVAGRRARDLPEILADTDRVLDPLGARGARFLRTAGRVESDGDRWSLLVHDAPVGADPARAVWIPLASADLAALGMPDALVPAARRWIDELGGGPAPRERPDWANPGGVDPFLRWVDVRVRETGAVPTGAPEIVQQWSISLVLRVRTDRGTFFAKAVGALFAAEPAITVALATRAPRHLPTVLASDPGRGWLLLADAGITPLHEAGTASGGTDGQATDGSDTDGPGTDGPGTDGPGTDGPGTDGPEVDGQAVALRALAHMQRSWTDDIAGLRAAGCPDRGPATLAADLEAVLDDVTDAGRRVPSIALDPEGLAALAAAVEQVATIARAAVDDPLPTTLLHGDFHPGNAGLRADGSACLLDWSDAAVGHPFVDAEVWLSHAPADRQVTLRDAYLEVWADVAPLPVLREALDRADVLAAAYQLVTAARLMEAVEEDDRVLFAGGVLFWARRLLGRLGHDELRLDRV